MLSEKYIVSLIMKGNNLSALKIGILRKYRSEHPSNFTSKPGFEIVQNQFWPVIGRISAFEIHTIRFFLSRSLKLFKK